MEFRTACFPTYWAEWHYSQNTSLEGLGEYLARKLGMPALRIAGAEADRDYAYEISKDFDPDVAFPFNPEKTAATGEIEIDEMGSLLNWAASEGYIAPGHWVVTYNI